MNALKGQYHLAQGNALGNGTVLLFYPIDIMLFGIIYSQGVALG